MCVEPAAVFVGAALSRTHHSQGHDTRQVLLGQLNLRLHLLRSGPAGWVLHLPGHPAAAQWLWKALHFQIYLEHPLEPRVRSVRGECKQANKERQQKVRE